MANVISGNDYGIYVGGTLISCITNASLSSTRTEIDVTCKDNNGDRAVIQGGATTNVSFTMFCKADQSYGFEDLWDIYNAKTEVSLAYGDFTNMTLYMQATLNELTMEAPLNGGLSLSGKFSVTGSITKTET